MTTDFFIGDTHFGHKNIINFESTKPFRPFKTVEEHDEEIIRRWNSVVGTKHRVWHLGDFCFGKKNLPIAARLNGDKRLVMGNHDRYETSEYLKYFSKLYGAAELYDIVLTHIPVHPDQFQRYSLNIHGHLHTHVIPDKRYIGVSAEQVNLTPISLDDIRLKVLG